MPPAGVRKTNNTLPLAHLLPQVGDKLVPCMVTGGVFRGSVGVGLGGFARFSGGVECTEGMHSKSKLFSRHPGFVLGS